MKFSVWILIFHLLISCDIDKPKKQDVHAALLSKIDSVISQQKFNGVILAAVDTTVLYSKAIGFSDLENKVKMDLDDQFIIGSISKQITAVLILREYENGNIGLDDTISQYLTAINQAWIKEVTIHQLLTHTHGIVALDQPLEFKQGSQFRYSQIGYELLAQVLENVTGKSFEKLLTEFFEACGLKNTFHPNNTKYKHLVKGYEANEKGDLVYRTTSLNNYVPAGSMISNAMDLKKWNEMLYSGQLVTKETLKLMTTKYATRVHPIFETVAYGYGLLFKDGEQSVQVGALGYAPGFVSACYHYPQTNMNLVVLENTANNLNDFKQTFVVHTEIMKLMKKECLVIGDRM
ncbi:serine hydrolase domain-containing protein [Aureispira sp. CCB-E]|uniref:serine hydrolase domain-containing protein n=1 Tax=Aureispira sp. CCB-E TaxID=3051121 RepID=UPI00286913EB|nr:serine hydrolase domain-containing protein [Aureispira sp. CCB-E]WMX17007.1 serine hydrolase domain-containing protein [Aureispira sp. CCB-E]